MSWLYEQVPAWVPWAFAIGAAVVAACQWEAKEEARCQLRKALRDLGEKEPQACDCEHRCK